MWFVLISKVHAFENVASQNNYGIKTMSIDRFVTELSCVLSLALKVQANKYTIVEEFIKDSGHVLISEQEHARLLSRANKTQAEIDGEVKKQFEMEIKNMNTELNHQVDKIKLQSALEKESLKIKLESLEASQVVPQISEDQ